MVTAAAVAMVNVVAMVTAFVYGFTVTVVALSTAISIVTMEIN